MFIFLSFFYSMMIKRLVLKCWKTHFDSCLEFANGTNVIVGKIGSGKSSVLDAVSYALFGTFPNLSTRKVSIDEVIMARPSLQSVAIVELDFLYEGKDYSVKRVVKRSGSNEAELRSGGLLIAGPKTSDVNKKVEEILGINYDLFSRAIYAEQNQLDAFLKMSPSQRKEKLDELLGLDKYESARSSAVTLSTKLKKYAEEKKRFVDEQKKKIDFARVEEYKLKASEKEAEVSSLESSLVSFERAVSKKKSELVFFESLEKRHVELEKRIVSVSSRLASLRDQCFAIEKRLSGLDFDGLLEKKAFFGKKLSDLVEQKNSCEREVERLRSFLVSLREQRASLNSELLGFERSIKSIDSIHGSCPVCKRPMQEHEKSSLVKELSEGKSRVYSLILEKDSLVRSSGKSLLDMELKAKELDKELESLRKQVFEVDSLFSSASELKEKRSLIQDLEKELYSLNSELASLGFDPSRLQSLRSEYSTALAELERVKADLRGSKEVLSEIKKSISVFETTLKNISVVEAEAFSFSSLSESVSVFVGALSSTQVELRELMVENINFAMTDISPKIYPYGDIKDVRLVLVDGSYEVFARTFSDELLRVEGILSGGERSCVAITLRIALSLVLTKNLGWIMLDEPTHNLDSSAVSKLSLAIGERLPELVGQVFIITHDKALESAGTGKLYYFERDKDSNGPTKVF